MKLQRKYLTKTGTLYLKMSKIKLIYDFFRLWIKWRDRKEAWEDAKFINDKKIQGELKEMDKESIKNNI